MGVADTFVGTVDVGIAVVSTITEVIIEVAGVAVVVEGIGISGVVIVVEGIGISGVVIVVEGIGVSGVVIMVEFMFVEISPPIARM